MKYQIVNTDTGEILPYATALLTAGRRLLWLAAALWLLPRIWPLLVALVPVLLVLVWRHDVNIRLRIRSD